MKTIKSKQKTKKKVTIKESKNYESHINLSNKKSQTALFRETWLQEGIELVDITPLCEIQINCHGECNSINEPEERIYHIKILYRDEIIACCGGNKISVIDDDKYCVWVENDLYDDGVIIFRKVKIRDKQEKLKSI